MLGQDMALLPMLGGHRRVLTNGSIMPTAVDVLDSDRLAGRAYWIHPRMMASQTIESRAESSWRTWVTCVESAYRGVGDRRPGCPTR